MHWIMVQVLLWLEDWVYTYKQLFSNIIFLARTPLHEACRKGNRSIIQALLDAGARACVNQVDEKGEILF